ncbi:AimR family lysis-lysogeny pheromone receptor [Bacillus sp. SCS-151]|uniref:AimR family lysis-lysogeny pheromone receptor n=1 Tax=Nanhaiella sioensis TaxID=3115293 RepID=UPI0039794912
MTRDAAASTLEFGTEFKKLIKKYPISQKELAEKFGIDETTFSKVLKGTRESDFEKILAAVKYIATFSKKIKVEKLMLLYIRELRNYDNVKVAMEYCDTHNFLGQLQRLCEYFWSKAKESNELKAWADLYYLSIQRKLGKISLTDWYTKLKLMEIEPSCKELEIYRSLRALENDNFNRNFVNISNDMLELKEIIAEVENTYLRFSFGVRLGEFLQTIYVRSGRFDEAEELALQTLGFSIGKGFNAFATITLAERNIQDQFEIAVQYFKKAADIYREMDRPEVVSEIVKKMHFVQLVHGVNVPMEELEHKQNIAFKYILSGNTAEGLTLLEQVEDEEDYQEPLRDYMRGLATGDREFYWKSLSELIEQNDKLYGFFPMQALLRLGESETGVKGLYNIHKAESR